jgi:2-amino-4-hydroxy-6-hydroxymethyldihydropteridine diphosphokinase
MYGMPIAFLSLGSNIGDRLVHLRDAIGRLEGAGRVICMSSFYETEPVEFTDQPWFVNCVVALETSKTPLQLLAAILDIERQMGRRRLQKKGPRSIDIDILLFDGEVINTKKLIIPHPAMHERRFVLEPLDEIARDLMHPVLKKTIHQLNEELPAGQEVRKIKC